MKIAVLVKILPDDQDIQVKGDRTLDFSRAKSTVSTYDLNAIEAAAQLAAKADAQLVAVTCGPKSINDSKTRKNILSRGVDELYMLTDDGLELADAYQTGRILAAMIQKIGDVDLVIAGDGSADLYAQQVDVQTAEALGWPAINGGTALDTDGATVTVARILETERESIRMPLPAVVSVAPEVALPRIAGMKDVLAAGKKPVVEFTAEELGGIAAPTVETVEILAPVPTPRKKQIFDAADEGAIDAFVAALREVM
ncbi:putative electron transfer flavoprotein FixA [Parvibacter caecicola]|uniref:Electron transfer flavoprotein small subunit n=1 Tax=Parvibacter caecicola TaxID=747645 RepID=A0A3N0ABX0_9ACTN|nr:putative electron transfer flavoprotein FixA [Parvibacter caecicola]MBB3171301.1 electron transfer flavoprotein beta subunit [Parvibacter caecicola]MCR2041179.1 putative electron transfer flavoprotein FixA [Parvibacter caecicola]RNL11631.1 electron transfer flavoprotein [Parvibacter caecicola]TJW10765.1 putative electron transfer flavoprotein FixA [Parvibacter caecicola]